LIFLKTIRLNSEDIPRFKFGINGNPGFAYHKPLIIIIYLNSTNKTKNPIALILQTFSIEKASKHQFFVRTLNSAYWCLFGIDFFYSRLASRYL